MSEENLESVDVEAVVPEEEAATEQAAETPPTLDIPTEGTEKPKSGSFKNAIEKSMESLSKALSSALEDRANVVMVRVNDEALQHLDMLVEAEITKSRSESAAFLISEGIKSNQALFDRIREITEQIAALRAQLREAVQFDEPHEQ